MIILRTSGQRIYIVNLKNFRCSPSSRHWNGFSLLLVLVNYLELKVSADAEINNDAEVILIDYLHPPEENTSSQPVARISRKRTDQEPANSKNGNVFLNRSAMHGFGGFALLR
ncbi:uncharacterized protein LOC134215744 [Armigeres subalbatus]|uniref:uncharacterized protein LOC134215744 n=1 Tax=Armigeres subalbatus TaxID=124917 RepID=UPI002ED5B3B8